MAKRPLTQEEQLALDLRRYESIISNPVFRNRGTARNIDMQPQNAAAVAQMIQNNSSLNPGGMLSTTTNNTPGLISDANAGSSMPVMQPAMQTNTQIPTQQTTSSNIFGDVLGTVFPGIDQSNKQLINAAILQGSLELLKPRQAGENLASQFGRAITAGQKVGTDLEKQALEKLVTQFGLQKTAAEIQELQKTKPGKQVSITKEKRELFEKVIDTVYDTDPSFKTTVDLIKEKVGTDISSNLGDEQRRAIELEAMSINASTGLGAVESTKIAAQNFLTGQKSIPTVSGEDRFAGRTIKEKK